MPFHNYFIYKPSHTSGHPGQNSSFLFFLGEQLYIDMMCVHNLLKKRGMIRSLDWNGVVKLKKHNKNLPVAQQKLLVDLSDLPLVVGHTQSNELSLPVPRVQKRGDGLVLDSAHQRLLPPCVHESSCVVKGKEQLN